MWLDWGDDGSRHSVLGFETWVWWLVGVSIVSVGVGGICGHMESMALAFWCESVGGIVGS